VISHRRLGTKEPYHSRMIRDPANCIENWITCSSR
jgi:hypothetical protein